jgi:hypothetical protein
VAPPITLLSVQNSLDRSRFLSNRGTALEVSCSEGCTLKGEVIVDRSIARRAGIGAAEVVVASSNGSLTVAGKTSLLFVVNPQYRGGLARIRRFRVTIEVTVGDLLAVPNSTLVTKRVVVGR